MKKNQLQIFKVRDLRQKTQFKIDDEYLNSWAKYLKPTTTAIYTSLCRHAEFHTQKAFPSQKKIAFEHGISISTVKRGLKNLLKYKIIAVEKERKKGMFSNYIYYLLDKSGWKKPTIGQKRPMVTPQVIHHRSFTIYGKRPTKDTKRLRIQIEKDTKKKKRDSSFSKKKLKPYYEGLQMRKSQGKWWVIPDDGGSWLEFAGSEKDIKWR